MAQASELEAPRETPDVPEDAPETPTVAEDPEGNVTVSLPEKPGRKERRESAVFEAKAAAKAAEERASRLEREIAELRGHVMARPSVPQYQPQPTEDPHAREIGQIRNEQETIQAAIRSGSIQDAQQLERMRTRFYELDQRKDEVIEDRATRRALDQFRRQQSNQGGDYEETILRSEYPDVVSHQQAMRWAKGRYDQMIAEGKPNTLQTSRDALAEAAQRFSLRQQSMPAPSPGVQQRFGAVPSQAGARTSSNEVRLDASQKKMALARWPSLDEHDAYARMAGLMRKSAATDENG